MECIYTVGLGFCLMHLLHNIYTKATITFISNQTKFTSNGKTSSSMCSRRSHHKKCGLSLLQVNLKASQLLSWGEIVQAVKVFSLLWADCRGPLQSNIVFQSAILWGNLLLDGTNYLYQIWNALRIELTLKRAIQCFTRSTKTLEGRLYWLNHTGKLEWSTDKTDNQKPDLVWEKWCLHPNRGMPWLRNFRSAWRKLWNGISLFCLIVRAVSFLSEPFLLLWTYCLL